MSFEGILSDIKVLDFSTLLPGPLASLFLSEMGAEVIKVERLKLGDEMRRKTPEIDGTNVSFAILNRGKSMGTFDKKDLSREKLLGMMAGGEELDKLEVELKEIDRTNKN